MLFLQRLFAHSPFPIGNGFELDVSAALAYHVDAARVEPAPQILALTDVEELQVSAAFHDGFDACARYSDATAHAQVAEFEEMERDATQRSIGDGGAAEGEVEVC
jgi:hypothetical protein